jgi:DMSO reductase anchor subunit
MGGSFNTREFFHGRPALVVGAARWAFLIFVFPVPGWLIGWGGGSLESFVAAFAIQFAGLLAERWLFFAEARHPQNLYYQSMA